MESLEPILSPNLLELMNDIIPDDKENKVEQNIVDGSSDYDFDSDDDSRADKDYAIETPEPQRASTSSFANILSDKNTQPCSNFRSIPSVYQSSESDIHSPELTKKKQKNPEFWKQHVRQKLRESGKKYTNIDGKTMPERNIKPPCKHTCFYFCTKNFSEDDRRNINTLFWKLSDKEKPLFYCKFVKKDQIERRRVRESESMKKHQIFKFYLQNGETIHRVCKFFFLNTLDISETRIYYYFRNLNDASSGCPKSSNKGKNVKKVIKPEEIQAVNNHIASFPIVDSHYCRASSSKKYLESHITITKMYELYQECTIDPVKISIYRKQFASFNLGIHKPKKDQCDRCVIFKSQKSPTDDEITEYNIHKDDKLAMKAERDLDRQNRDLRSAIICFDLQSVFALPKGNASSFYYKRKLNVYNMTATTIVVDKPKVTYCAIWNEANSGRSGDDIASSIIKILQYFLRDYPQIENITLWSDSCVAQNKNKVLSTALLFFLQNQPNLKKIYQKFSTPGHSLIQEVDCIHSVIDRHLKNLEIHSPVSLLRNLKNISSRNIILKLIQMQSSDFRAYSKKSTYLNFAAIPFTKVKYLFYDRNDLFKLNFKTSGRDLEYNSKSIKKIAKKKSLPTPNNIFEQNVNIIENRTKTISKEKIDDIKSLLVFMPAIDQEYYKVTFKIK